jgi:hypothetical protein
MNTISLWEKVTRSGPWGVLVLIIVVWLGQSVGLLPSEAKDAKAAMKDHMFQQERAIRETQETNEKLAAIERLMRDNQERAAVRDRIICLNAAKTIAETERCAQIR